MENIKVLYGGSFNPPTKAHYTIAKKVIERYKVNDFVFLPTSKNYQKDNLVDNYYRYEMLMIVSSKLMNARVSDFELKQDKYMGTDYALKHFQGFYFLLGADNLVNLNSWINYPDVIINNKFIVLKRDSFDLSKIKEINLYSDNFLIFDEFKEINASASLFRETKNKELLLDDVYEYINRNNLY